MTYYASSSILLEATNDELIEALEWLGDRISWLDKERSNGGNFQHLTARIEEASYIHEKFNAAITKAKEQ